MEDSNLRPLPRMSRALTPLPLGQHTHTICIFHFFYLFTLIDTYFTICKMFNIVSRRFRDGLVVN